MYSHEDFEIKSLNEALTLSADFYCNEHWLKIEQKNIFEQTWQLAAHSENLLNCGDYVVCDVAGKSILIVRTKEKKLNAFYNVCRHRAGPIATSNGKASKMLTCKYHGWTYTHDGQLCNATEMQESCKFTTGNIYLNAVNVHEWQGFVFVSLSHTPSPFTEIFTGIEERIRPVDISVMHFAKKDTYNIACNWKVYIDNFLEGYHLPFVHPGLSKILDYQVYNTELHKWYSLQHSPLRNSDEIYGNGHAYYYFIYPNMMFNIMPGRLQTNRIIPNGHERCIVEFSYYYLNDPEVKARAYNEQEFSDEIQREDMLICEHVQKGLASGAYHNGHLSPKRESGLWHFQNLLRTTYSASVTIKNKHNFTENNFSTK